MRRRPGRRCSGGTPRSRCSSCVGRMFSSGGITKKIATKTAIPPAVLRVIAPSAEREDPDHRQIERPAEDRPRDAGRGERDLQDLMGAEDRLGREEVDEDARDRHSERHGGKDRDLRPEDGQPAGDGSERGADHPGRVLAADEEDAENADRELRDAHADQRDRDRVSARRSSSDMWLQRATVITAARQEKPIVSRIAVKSDQSVERSDRNFVHSERMTRSWVTRSCDNQGGGRAPSSRVTSLRFGHVPGHLVQRVFDFIARRPLICTSSRTRGGVEVEGVHRASFGNLERRRLRRCRAVRVFSPPSRTRASADARRASRSDGSRSETRTLPCPSVLR